MTRGSRHDEGPAPAGRSHTHRPVARSLQERVYTYVSVYSLVTASLSPSETTDRDYRSRRDWESIALPRSAIYPLLARDVHSSRLVFAHLT